MPYYYYYVFLYVENFNKVFQKPVIEILKRLFMI